MAKDPLAPGLYLAATPIGNARDITLRVLDALATADVLAAEDTRSLRRLMEIHGIAREGRPLVAYHDHSGPAATGKLLDRIAGGASVLYASEAGTPLVSDPGFELVRAAAARELPVTALPGASAVLSALAVAGLPTDRFCFLGFPPRQAKAQRMLLAELAALPATLVFYESPKRVQGFLDVLCESLGEDRPAALCRELTKRFEDVRRAPLGALRQSVAEAPPKGEIVILIDRAPVLDVSLEAIDAALGEALAEASLRDAVDSVARALGAPRRRVYRRALDLTKEGDT